MGMPSSAQIAFARDLGCPQEIIDNSDSAVLGRWIENNPRRSRSRHLRSVQAQPARSSRDQECWRNMYTWHQQLLDRGHTDEAAARSAVEHFDPYVRHVDRWPDEVRNVFRDRLAPDELRAEIAAEYAYEMSGAAAG